MSVTDLLRHALQEAISSNGEAVVVLLATRTGGFSIMANDLPSSKVNLLLDLAKRGIINQLAENSPEDEEDGNGTLQ